MGAPTIVVRSPNWLGDTVMALPALRALRAARPEATLVVVGRWAWLLAGQDTGDALIDYPRPLGARCRLAGRLRAMRPELALLLPNSLESALMARCWAAATRLGYDADGRRALLTEAVALPVPRRHQVDEYQALVGAAAGGAAGDTVPTWRPVAAPALEREAAALLAGSGDAPPGRLVGLHLGAAFASSKRWPVDAFARLAGRLGRQGLIPVLMGSPADLHLAVAVTSARPGGVRSLVGQDRPELLPHLLAGLACLVSGDTGVAHLASALGTPTVTLFGPTDPRLTAPRGPRARVVVGPAPCAPCFLSACPIDHACLAGVTAEAVAEQVEGMIAA